MKLLQEPGNKQLVQKMELEHIADRKLPPSKQRSATSRRPAVRARRAGHSVHLTDRGVDFMSPTDHDAFVLPDSREECIASTTTTSCTRERRSSARELEIEYARRASG
jgi:preprotein translocase subunit SecA